MFQIGAEWAISVSAQISEIASLDDLRPSLFSCGHTPRERSHRPLATGEGYP